MKIVTALVNEKINKKIQENKNLEVIGKDIQYQEALIEILEKNNIDLLILNSSLPGEMNLYELINIIKYKFPKIEIYIFLEKNNEKYIEFLIKKGIYNIFFNNKITEDELIEKITKNKENNTEIKNKKIKKNIKNKIKILEKIKKIRYKETKEKLEKKAKIITIIGSPKIGKSIFLVLLSLNIDNKKMLLNEYNSSENDIKTIFGRKEKAEKISINSNIDLLINNQETKNEQEKYDYIFFEVHDIEKSKELIEKSNQNILLIEPNLIGIKESSKMLEILINKWNISKQKIRIIFNKTNIFSIKKEVLNQMFADFEILENLKEQSIYNLFINTNLKAINIKINKKYKKIGKKIIEKI